MLNNHRKVGRVFKPRYIESYVQTTTVTKEENTATVEKAVEEHKEEPKATVKPKTTKNKVEEENKEDGSN